MKKKKIVFIILSVFSLLLFMILIDTLQARIFKHSPIISWKENLSNNSYADKGIIIDTYYCTNEQDTVNVSWHFKTSKFACPEIVLENNEVEEEKEDQSVENDDSNEEEKMDSKENEELTEETEKTKTSEDKKTTSTKESTKTTTTTKSNTSSTKTTTTSTPSKTEEKESTPKEWTDEEILKYARQTIIDFRVDFKSIKECTDEGDKWQKYGFAYSCSYVPIPNTDIVASMLVIETGNIFCDGEWTGSHKYDYKKPKIGNLAYLRQLGYKCENYNSDIY